MGRHSRFREICTGNDLLSDVIASIIERDGQEDNEGTVNFPGNIVQFKKKKPDKEKWDCGDETERGLFPCAGMELLVCW